jgi:hypothetical protein
MNNMLKKALAFSNDLAKDLGLKFLNGILLAFIWILLMWMIGFTAKMSYIMFFKGWDFL